MNKTIYKLPFLILLLMMVALPQSTKAGIGIGVGNSKNLWTSGVMPYRIKSGFSATQQARILDAIEECNNQLSISIIPYNSSVHTNFLSFEPGDRCWSQSAGMKGGEQRIELKSTCSFGSTMHEIHHALGIKHEHQRSDRDDFVTIIWANIEKGKEGNFDMPDISKHVNFGNYDYGSIMHYSSGAFGNGNTTISVPSGVTIGQRLELSDGDINAVNRLYAGSSRFGTAQFSGDFNGDGFADLVISEPTARIKTHLNAGRVVVYYGAQSHQTSIYGLSSIDCQVFHQDTPGIAGGAEDNDYFGQSVAVGDFNGDGRDDLAIGAPGDSVGSIDSAGVVNVIYGSSSGLTTVGDQIWHQDSSGIKGVAEEQDRFGQTLVAGDFNGDGKDDLAIGVPLEDWGSITDSGQVNVIYGSAFKLTESGNQIWHQDSSGITGAAEAYDRFGSKLATGDFNGDGKDDLAIGVQFEDLGSIKNAGMVNVIYGSSSKLTSSGNQGWHQNSSGILGVAEAYDEFSSSLAAGDFNGDGKDDLAIGVAREDVGSIINAGSVNVIYGSSSKLTSSGNQEWTQNSTGVIGISEEFDLFGYSVVAGDFNGDGKDDLAISAPLEDVGSVNGAGVVNVLYGSSSKLNSSGDQYWHQDSSGIKGKAETNDQFGATLAAGDFNGDGKFELSIGVPFEDIEDRLSGTWAGITQVIYGSSSKLTSSKDQILD